MSEKGEKVDREGSRLITAGYGWDSAVVCWGPSDRGVCVTVLRTVHRKAKKLGHVPPAPAPHWLRADPCYLNSPAWLAFVDCPTGWQSMSPRCLGQETCLCLGTAQRSCRIAGCAKGMRSNTSPQTYKTQSRAGSLQLPLTFNSCFPGSLQPAFSLSRRESGVLRDGYRKSGHDIDNTLPSACAMQLSHSPLQHLCG